MGPASFCSIFAPPSPISRFISNQPYLSLLETKCTTMRNLQIIHAQLIKTGLAKNTIAASRLLALAAAGDVNYAYLVFTQIQKPNLFIWNTIIRAFSNSSTPITAISLFLQMLLTSPVQPQRLTYPSLFKAYSQLGLARDGTQLHARVIKQGLQFDPFIRNTVINMYANCGFLSEAIKLFDEDEGEGDDFDMVSWNTMIMGMARNGEIENAQRLFDKMPSRNALSWNSMISGCVRNGKCMEALQLFGQMQMENVRPCEFTMVSLLNASACLGALKQGEWIHDYIRKDNMELNMIVVTAIVDMYCKCGSVDKGLAVFEAAPPSMKGLSCWNAIILGLARNGREHEALTFFSRLEESTEHKPDGVSFIGALAACCHAGLVDEAREYFSLMTQKYKIQPSMKHYGCLIDVLGRVGMLEEAKEVIRRMPMKADEVIWGSLLSGCWKHENVEIGELAAENLRELNPRESCGYVLMSNVYAKTGDFERAMEERVSMRREGIKKEAAGCSLIEVDGVVHEFLAGGRMLHLLPQIFHDTIYCLYHDLNNSTLPDAQELVFNSSDSVSIP